MDFVFKILIAVVVVILLVYGGNYAYKTYKGLKKLSEHGIGKDMVIVIEEGKVVDYTQIDIVRPGNGSPRLWFNTLGRTEKAQLIEYMKNNNLKIKPGVYEVSQSAYFKELKKILKFEKIED